LTEDAGKALDAWRALDRAPDPGRLLAFLDELSAQPAVLAAKRRSFELLALSPGDRVLDAGCGTGTDAIALLERVTPGGEVVGVDVSESAIAAAWRAAGSRAGISFQPADLLSLPFPDASFDASRADRALLHVARPEVAVGELVRVIAPGGRVVLSEALFSTPNAAGPRAPARHEGWRVLPFLPHLLQQAGAEQVTLERTEAEVALTETMRSTLQVDRDRVRLAIVHVAGRRAS
jgi:ubiquinone/menaquinone biosynthesis C-methylase UbiE